MLLKTLVNLYHIKEEFPRSLSSDLFHSILNVQVSSFRVIEKNKTVHISQMIPKTFQKVNKSNTRKLRINEGPAKQAEQNTNCTSAGWGKTINSNKNNNLIT